MSELSNSEKVTSATLGLTLGFGAIMGAAACGREVDAKVDHTPTPIVQTIDSDFAAKTSKSTTEVEYIEQEVTPENLIVDLGILGKYESLYNWDTGMEHIGISPDYQIQVGSKTLEDLKKEGGVIELALPFDSIVNVSGGDKGKFYVENDEWNLGNPAENQDGDFVIEAGQTFRGEWEAGNDSAGLEIMVPPSGSFDDFEYSETVRPNYQTEEEQKEFTPLDLETNLQALGTYKWVYDSIEEKYILQIAEKHQVALGQIDLEDVKENGGKFIMSFPWETRLNSIVGLIKVNGDQVLNGNPVLDSNGNVVNKEYMIPANTLIEAIYQPNNPSNGFQVEIDWPLE